MKFKIIMVLFMMFFISCTTEKLNRNADDDITESDSDVTDTDETDADAADMESDIENDADAEGDADAVADSDEESDADSDEIVCTKLSITGMYLETEWEYYGSISPELGSADKEDGIVMMFYAPEEPDSDSYEDYVMKVGEYELGKGNNAKVSTCTECVFVSEDYDEEEGTMSKMYAPESGVLKITGVKEGTMESKGTITAKMVQVYLDMVSGEAIPVPGGACLELDAEPWDTICVPACEGKVCGIDGCGGFCGDGCEEGTQCNDDQTECIPCTEITLSGLTSTPAEAPVYRGTLTENVAGADTDDRFQLVFSGYQDAGTFDLATGDNANFSTCKQCVLLYADASTDSETATYFQRSGTVTIDELVKDSYGCMSAESKGKIDNIVLVEVSFEGVVSTPVKDGGCFQLSTASWDTMPVE
ncbi:MAG TPA: hypothetical protein P5044_06775 [bacterium]|nr:hypothetical protein [bacterium]